ncbi:MAG: hypothetical protein HUU12_15115 [Anaerolineales bacterium]|nr:hypothetical protein [Anaerolineales bacterium]NUQ60674.1 hypothetical protein [Anaerolineales bacterium]
MRTVEFRRLLDDANALRVRFETDHGQILRFIVQLECLFSEDGEWTPVVRYDTAHGYAHRDVMRPHRKRRENGNVRSELQRRAKSRDGRPRQEMV